MRMLQILDVSIVFLCKLICCTCWELPLSHAAWLVMPISSLYLTGISCWASLWNFTWQTFIEIIFQQGEASHKLPMVFAHLSSLLKCYNVTAPNKEEENWDKLLYLVNGQWQSCTSINSNDGIFSSVVYYCFPQPSLVFMTNHLETSGLGYLSASNGSIADDIQSDITFICSHFLLIRKIKIPSCFVQDREAGETVCFLLEDRMGERLIYFRLMRLSGKSPCWSSAFPLPRTFSNNSFIQH